VIGDREQGTGNREQGTGDGEQNAKNREKFVFQVLTKDFKYVIIILIRKNYLKLFSRVC
jgi:vacuolar-type H+-ATPase subunit F/Vma7